MKVVGEDVTTEKTDEDKMITYRWCIKKNVTLPENKNQKLN